MAPVRAIFCVLCSVLFCGSIPAQAQMPAEPAALLNHLTGVWTLRGAIAGKPTVHDVQAEWVLNREYEQLQEISRETNAAGNPAYEAIVYIGWDAKAQQFVCLWLDSTSGDGLSSGIIARAKPAGDSIPFVFTLSASDQIHTTFTYDKASGTWQWLIDNISNGKTQRFADTKLTRVR